MGKITSNLLCEDDSKDDEEQQSRVFEGFGCYLIKLYGGQHCVAGALSDRKGISMEKRVYFTIFLQFSIIDFCWSIDSWLPGWRFHCLL